MSIQSNFEYHSKEYSCVTFKIVRVFGSKTEGWNAVFAFVPNELEFVEKNFKGLITIGCDWVDENPYPILYKKMEEYLTNGGFQIEKVKMASEWINDLIPAEEAPLEVTEPPKPKRTRKSKVKKDGKSTSGS